MLMDIELPLLVYFTLLSFISAILPAVLKPLWICLGGPTSEEKHVVSEISDLKTQQQGISMKDNFSAYSKLQRKINSLEELQKQLAQSRVGNNLKLKLFITYGLQSAVGVVMLISSIWYRNVPLVVLNQSLFPYQSFFSYPSNIPSAITPHAWVIISRISMKTICSS